MGLTGLKPNQPHKPKGRGTQSKTTPRPHKSHFKVSMTQSYGGTLSEKKISLRQGGRKTWVQMLVLQRHPRVMATEKLPRSLTLNAGLTQVRSTRGLQQNKGIKNYPLTALICFPSVHRHCSSQSASPWHSSTPNFQQISFPPVALEV